MKRFAFRLERVLRQRALLEESAEQALGAARRAERQAAEACEAVRAEIERAAAAMTSRLTASVNGSDLLLHARYAAGLRGRESARRRERAEAETRSRERHRAAEAHEAQAVLDEVAGQRYVRRQGEE